MFKEGPFAIDRLVKETREILDGLNASRKNFYPNEYYKPDKVRAVHDMHSMARLLCGRNECFSGPNISIQRMEACYPSANKQSPCTETDSYLITVQHFADVSQYIDRCESAPLHELLIIRDTPEERKVGYYSANTLNGNRNYAYQSYSIEKALDKFPRILDIYQVVKKHFVGRYPHASI
jgi:hypothetical protein